MNEFKSFLYIENPGSGNKHNFPDFSIREWSELNSYELNKLDISLDPFFRLVYDVAVNKRTLSEVTK